MILFDCASILHWRQAVPHTSQVRDFRLSYQALQECGEFNPYVEYSIIRPRYYPTMTAKGAWLFMHKS